jgi:phosphoribosylaminoimidazole-succinocarboxamide synthase
MTSSQGASTGGTKSRTEEQPISQLQPLPLQHLRRGKVREVYVVDDDRLLLVATDRVSAFDVVMNEAIPYKGAVLTQITAWWLRQLEGELRHHMLASDVDDIIDAVPALGGYRATLAGRAMLCKRTEVFPVECVIRGYLSGSAWKEYKASGTLAGESLAPQNRESSRVDPPLISPATKAETGHDENITAAQVARIVGPDVAAELERLSRLVYGRGRDIAANRGIIIADTKFEFGRDHEGRITLIDEVLTPDSSRFWPAEHYQPGRAQPSFDKQPLRDYLDGERRAGRWNGDAPPPPLPKHVVDATSARYLDAYRRITGSELALSHPAGDGARTAMNPTEPA